MSPTFDSYFRKCCGQQPHALPLARSGTLSICAAADVALRAFFGAAVLMAAFPVADASPEVKLAWAMRDWRGMSVAASRHSRVKLACAALAVQDVNARNGAISSSLANISHNFTFSLRYGVALAEEWYQQIDQVATLLDSEDIAAILIDSSSQIATYLATSANYRAIPALLLDQTSPIFGEYPQEQWYQFFRMNPHLGFIGQPIDDYLARAQWTHMAVLFDETDAFSLAVKQALQNRVWISNITLSFHTMTAQHNSAADLASVQSIRASGVKVVFSTIYFGRETIEVLLEREGMLGAAKYAEGTAYLTLEREVTETDLSTGRLEGAVIFNPVRELKDAGFAALQNRWMVQRNEGLRLPVGGVLTSQESRYLERSMLSSSSCYDAIVAIAMAVDLALNQATTGISRTGLTAALAQGIQFDSLGVNGGEFSGKPWEHPESKSRFQIINVVNLRAIEVNGPQDTVFPGSTSHVPISFVPTACTEVSCGVGTCVQAASLGRPPGWCRCDEGRVGRTCEQIGSLITDPGATLDLRVNFFEIEFLDFADHGGEFSISLHFRVQWDDGRLGLLPGTYTEFEIQQLVQERQFWVPSFEMMEVHSVTTQRTAALVNYPCNRTAGMLCTTVNMEVKMTAALSTHASWELYPFDVHTVTISGGYNDIPWRLQRDNVRGDSYGRWRALRDGDFRVGLKLTISGDDGSSVPQVDGVIDAQMRVARDIRYTMIRIILPSWVLLVVSWAGFYIKPTVLMPRFASGFLSCLAIYSFVTIARNQMPEGAPLTCLDAYMSCLSLLVGLAIVETVVAQLIYEVFSESLAKLIDKYSRVLFPITSCLASVSIPVGSSSLMFSLYFSHAIVAVFLIVSVSAILWVVKHFPSILLLRYLRLSVMYRTRADYHPRVAAMPWVTPTEKELGFLFAAIDTDNGGTVTTRDFKKWIETKMYPRFHKIEEEVFVNKVQEKFADMGKQEIPPKEFMALVVTTVKSAARYLRNMSGEGGTPDADQSVVPANFSKGTSPSESRNGQASEARHQAPPPDIPDDPPNGERGWGGGSDDSELVPEEDFDESEHGIVSTEPRYRNRRTAHVHPLTMHL